MARTRQIKPTFFLDEDLALCSREARLLFIGLWTIADREGRLEDRPRRLKPQIFPYDDDIGAAEITAMIDELERGGFVLRYHVDGSDYLLIRNFAKHQHVHHAEQESEIPEPPDDTKKPRTSAVQLPQSPPADPSFTSTTSTSNTASTSDTSKETISISTSRSGHTASGRDGLRPPNTRKGARASQRTRCPDGFEPSERLKEWASKSFPQLRLEEETEKFLDHHRAKGNTFADWEDAWRTWMRNAARWSDAASNDHLPPMAERLATDEDKRNYSPHGN